MKRERPKAGLINKPVNKTISKQDRKDLKILDDDFGLLHRGDMQDIIETCKSYLEEQQKIMRLFTTVYLN